MNRVFVDMDGPLVNFEARMLELSMDSQKLKTMPGAYLDMEPEPGGIQAIHSLIGMRYEVWLATKPPTGIPWAYADKVGWVLNHLPELKRRIILTHDKGLLGDGGDFLIDDRIHKANCLSFKGQLMHYTPGAWPVILEIFRVRRSIERNNRLKMGELMEAAR